MFKAWLKGLTFGGGLPVTFLILFAFFWVVRGKKVLASWIAGSGLFLLSVMVWPGTADFLAQPLFAWANQLDQSECLMHPACQAQAIVVLPEGIERSGYLTQATWLRLQQGVLFWQKKKAPFLVLTAGRKNEEGSSSGAEILAQEAQKMGVPIDAILLEKRAENTHENAVLTYALLKPRAVTKIILITSWLHLPRAHAAFQKAGFSTIPIMAETKPDLFLTMDHPDWLNGGGVQTVLNEYLGILVYKLTGWL